jgi:hypothetical protein
MSRQFLNSWTENVTWMLEVICKENVNAFKTAQIS